MPQQSAFPSLSPPRPYRPGPGADAAGPGAVPALWVAASEPVPSPGPARSAPAQSGGVFVTGAGELKAAIERWPALPGRTVVALRGELTPPAAANLLTAIRHAIRVGGRLLLIQAGAGGTSMV